MDEATFWSSTEVHPNGCLIWTRGSHERGYGRVRWRGKIRSAHRVAWELQHGEAPPDDRLVRHRCDDTRCVEPSHLELGTPLDNARDQNGKLRLRQRRPRSERERHMMIARYTRLLESADGRARHYRKRLQELE